MALRKLDFLVLLLEVNIAFEILLEEIEEVFNILSKEGEEAFKDKDFGNARILIEYGEKLKVFREKVKDLQDEWQNIFEKAVGRKVKGKKVKKRLESGLRTPEKEFIKPILQALVEHDGKAKMLEVLKRVYAIMKDKLNKYDMQPLPFNPTRKRWENTVQWARNTMVTEGLPSSDSPRGIWEITEKGRSYLEKNS